MGVFWNKTRDPSLLSNHQETCFLFFPSHFLVFLFH